MLRQTSALLKKGWTHNPGRTRRGGKNLAWRPKISEAKLNAFVPLNLVHPRRHPNSWQELQFNYLGYIKWPKSIAYYNAGNNFEITPEASWRLYLRCRDEEFWNRLHNEKTIIHILPEVERSPQSMMERVQDIFRHHLKRFGADHYIYNAVMQASAFAKNFSYCEQLFKEMECIGLDPNAQTYVNMMLAAKLCGLPAARSEQYFLLAIKNDALKAVMRLDTEFKMWMDQFDRFGSFTAASGFLSKHTDDKAKPTPEDMWALWGWHRSEPKFISRKDVIRQQVRQMCATGKELTGTLFTKIRRQPWARYNGMLPIDYKGPPYRPPTRFLDAPPHSDAP